jgi:hypothetical protein
METFYLVGAGIAAALFALWRAFAKGKAEARQETALKAAERQSKAERERVALDAHIQQDTDLAARARNSGIVRPDK